MTELLGWIGFALVTFSAICTAIFILAGIAAIVRDRRERKWRERCEAMINAVDALLLAKRLREDREVADLYAAWELPPAMGRRNPAR